MDKLKESPLRPPLTASKPPLFSSFFGGGGGGVLVILQNVEVDDQR